MLYFDNEHFSSFRTIDLESRISIERQSLPLIKRGLKEKVFLRLIVTKCQLIPRSSAVLVFAKDPRDENAHSRFRDVLSTLRDGPWHCIGRRVLERTGKLMRNAYEWNILPQPSRCKYKKKNCRGCSTSHRLKIVTSRHLRSYLWFSNCHPPTENDRESEI